MPRPPLPLETYGKIRRITHNGKDAAVANYRDTDGKVRKLMRTGKSPVAAENALKEALRDRLAPVGDVLTADSTLEVLAASWKAELLEDKKLSEGTKVNYRNALPSILKGVGGVRISEATPAKLHRYLQAVSKKTPGAARTYRVVLKHMLAHAVYAGVITANPIKETKAITPNAPIVKALRAPDIAAIRDILEAWDSGVDKYGRLRDGSLRDTMDMYGATAMRTAELLALEWPSFDFAAFPPTVTVSATVVRGLDGKLHLQRSLKTDKSHRELELPPFVVPMLLARQEKAYCDLVFPSAAGTPRWPDNLRRDWKTALDGTAYEGVTPGAFRKAVATLLSETMGPEAARDQLGHTGFGNLKSYVEQASRGPAAAGALQSLLAG